MKHSAKQFLARSAYRITHALARMLLREGMGYAVYSELARSAFVDAASEFDIEGRKLSDSRIAIMTGLSRKEVKRLKGKGGDDFFDDDSRHNRAVRVVTAWNREKKYRTKKGMPRVLPLIGESPNLSELVTEFSGGVPVRAVVDELSRVGAIVETRQGRWRLENSAYIPKSSHETVMKILGTDVPLLIGTIDHNLDVPQQQKRFQRKVCYDNVAVEDAELFRRYASDESFKLLKKLDQWLARAEENQRLKDKNNSAQKLETYTMGVGIFYFEESNDGVVRDD